MGSRHAIERWFRPFPYSAFSLTAESSLLFNRDGSVKSA
jgi:hypothetical protein